jgi:hypothetical protein
VKWKKGRETNASDRWIYLILNGLGKNRRRGLVGLPTQIDINKHI